MRRSFFTWGRRGPRARAPRWAPSEEGSATRLWFAGCVDDRAEWDVGRSERVVDIDDSVQSAAGSYGRWAQQPDSAADESAGVRLAYGNHRLRQWHLEHALEDALQGAAADGKPGVLVGAVGIEDHSRRSVKATAKLDGAGFADRQATRRCREAAGNATGPVQRVAHAGRRDRLAREAGSAVGIVAACSAGVCCEVRAQEERTQQGSHGLESETGFTGGMPWPLGLRPRRVLWQRRQPHWPSDRVPAVAA